MTAPTSTLLIFLTCFVSGAAILDLFTRRVAAALTLPVMAGAVVYQLGFGGQWLALLIAWTVIFLLWKLRFYGGGDAKVLMALFGFFPLLSLAWAQVGVSLAVSLPMLVYKYRRRLAEQVTAVGAMAITGNLLPPSREVTRQQGMPAVWVYALGWFVWFLVDVVILGNAV